MKITSSILLVLVTAMTLNVTLAGSSSTTDDHQSTINLLSIRNINAAVVPSSNHALIKRKSPKSKKSMNKKKKDDDDNSDDDEDKDNSKKNKNKNKSSSNKKKGGSKKGGSGNCKDRACPLELRPCPKDCPQSCGYLNSPDPCCPLLGTPTCPDY